MITNVVTIHPFNLQFMFVPNFMAVRYIVAETFHLKRQR